MIMKENDYIMKKYTLKYFKVKAPDKSTYSQMVHKNI